jgi:formylglycine-generating enzyme required for sulfatase activity
VCVDRYEAALENRPFSRPVDEVDASAYRAVVAKGIKPQVNVTAFQAETACVNAGKRLCTAAEWTAACRGPKNTLYPYGDKYVKGACNEGRQAPQRRWHPPNGRLDDPRLAEMAETVEPGGAFPQCVSAYGVYDLHGNVHEWVVDTGRDARFGLFLGGFFADAEGNGFGCTYKTNAHLKDYHDYSTGFRCCKDLTPTQAFEIDDGG